MDTDASNIENLKIALKSLEPIHFIGIGGSGMSPLAMFVASLGIKVTGSDKSQLDDDRFENLKIDLLVGHEDLKLSSDANTVILSSAIKSDNPELIQTVEKNKNILHRSELLSLIAKHFKLITVAGIHGKSTTSALISFLLERLRQSPSFIIGAEILSKDSRPAAFQVGSGPLLVIEADESDGSFLNYTPFISVVTNIDQDHMDYYKDMISMEDAFAKHISSIAQDGKSIVFWDHPRVRSVSQSNDVIPRLTYGSFIGSEIRLIGFSQVGFNASVQTIFEHKLINFSLPLIGKHNAFNALAALSVCHALELNVLTASKELTNFQGVSRRLFCHYARNGNFIYDDYAHNPVKISSCLEGLHQAFPDHQILVVFQPHRYSRTEALFDDFSKSFSNADLVIVTSVYAAGETPRVGLDGDELASSISIKSNVPTIFCRSLNEASLMLQSKCRLCTEHNTDRGAKFVAITIGAGDVWTVARDCSSSL
jgi:UDP-N-acetylmuramate--alanine ligase